LPAVTEMLAESPALGETCLFLPLRDFLVILERD
jgi:hypothetical protein